MRLILLTVLLLGQTTPWYGKDETKACWFKLDDATFTATASGCYVNQLQWRHDVLAHLKACHPSLITTDVPRALHADELRAEAQRIDDCAQSERQLRQDLKDTDQEDK